MDADRFDALAKRLTAPAAAPGAGTRRGLLRAFGAGALAGLLGLSEGPGAAEAQGGRRKVHGDGKRRKKPKTKQEPAGDRPVPAVGGVGVEGKKKKGKKGNNKKKVRDIVCREELCKCETICQTAVDLGVCEGGGLVVAGGVALVAGTLSLGTTTALGLLLGTICSYLVNGLAGDDCDAICAEIRCQDKHHCPDCARCDMSKGCLPDCTRGTGPGGNAKCCDAIKQAGIWIEPTNAGGVYAPGFWADPAETYVCAEGGTTCERRCGEREACNDGLCCATGSKCCGGGCTPVRYNDEHCGTCGNDCKDGQVCCGGDCVDTDDNCGGCTVPGDPERDFRCGVGQTCCRGKCRDAAYFDTSQEDCGHCLNDLPDTLTCCGGKPLGPKYKCCNPRTGGFVPDSWDCPADEEPGGDGCNPGTCGPDCPDCPEGQRCDPQTLLCMEGQGIDCPSCKRWDPDENRCIDLCTACAVCDPEANGGEGRCEWDCRVGDYDCCGPNRYCDQADGTCRRWVGTLHFEEHWDYKTGFYGTDHTQTITEVGSGTVVFKADGTVEIKDVRFASNNLLFGTCEDGGSFRRTTDTVTVQPGNTHLTDGPQIRLAGSDGHFEFVGGPYPDEPPPRLHEKWTNATCRGETFTRERTYEYGIWAPTHVLLGPIQPGGGVPRLLGENRLNGTEHYGHGTPDEYDTPSFNDDRYSVYRWDFTAQEAT